MLFVVDPRSSLLEQDREYLLSRLRTRQTTAYLPRGYRARLGPTDDVAVQTYYTFSEFEADDQGI